MTELVPPSDVEFRIIAMGVSGCGKSAVGRLLAEQLGATFLDGDDLHPESNIAKMASGTELTDSDREPWLQEIGARLALAHGSVVIPCSALKRSYRDVIRAAAPGAAFVHLHGSHSLLEARMASRPGHFMPVSLLNSQLATLEHLDADENGKVFDITDTPAAVAAAAARWLHRPIQ